MKILESATTVSDMLEIEQQLGYLRSDIESIEGRLRYLKDQVRFSTLTIKFYYDKPLSDEEADEQYLAAITIAVLALIVLVVYLIFKAKKKRAHDS